MSEYTQLDGYKAAAIIVKEHMRLASKGRPFRAKKGFKRTSAYKQGYWEGLLFAHCMHALGEFPASNCEAINRALTTTPTTHPTP